MNTDPIFSAPVAAPDPAPLLRLASVRPDGHRAWAERLRRVVASDLRAQRAAVLASGVRMCLGLCLVPLGLAVFTGVPLAPVAAWVLSVGVAVATVLLPVALIGSRLARHRHRLRMTALHDRGLSLNRDASGWVLRDRYTQVVLAAHARPAKHRDRKDVRLRTLNSEDRNAGPVSRVTATP